MRCRFRSWYGVQPFLERGARVGACVAALVFPSPSRAQVDVGPNATPATGIESAAVELEVVGRLEVSAERHPVGSEGRARIVGRITDENDVPLVADLEVRQGGRALTWRPCDSALNGTAASPRTNADGTFCGIVAAARRGGELRVRASAPHHEPVSVPAPLADERTATRPTFVSAPDQLDDDDELYVVELLASAGTTEGATVTLDLLCESAQHRLGEEFIRQSRMVRFEFSRPVTPPGRCQLSAQTLSPPTDLQAARDVLVVGRVQLDVSEIRREPDHLDLELTVTALGTPVDEGIVEARMGEDFRGSAAVRGGSARLRIARGPAAQVARVNFVPANPAHVAAEPLDVEVPKSGANWSWAPWHGLLLLGFGGWMTVAWLRPKRRVSTDTNAPPEVPQLQPAPATRGRVRGSILDAHSLEAIAGARVVLERREAVQNEPLEVTVSDEAGRFEFRQLFEESELLVLVCQHEDYMTLRASVVSAEARAFLQTRRRAVVGQLVAWAKRRGRPWDAPPEPTTGHVERVARDREDDATSSWAANVGRVAYGPESPVEARVHQLKAPPCSAQEPPREGSMRADELGEDSPERP